MSEHGRESEQRHAASPHERLQALEAAMVAAARVAQIHRQGVFPPVVEGWVRQLRTLRVQLEIEGAQPLDLTDPATTEE